ncbi:hypothetical protein DRP04_05880 [Archaeoglobales archaeon]|nr:MAG: hypothetical protein DRP04_05880 [Archaeoglobales archaeon]
MAEFIDRVRRLLEEKPALREVPIAIVSGKIVSLKEIAELTMLPILRLPSDEEIWELAKESYMRLAKAHKPFKIYTLALDLPTQITVQDCILHLEARDEIGEMLMKSYKSFLKQIYRWLGVA